MTNRLTVRYGGVPDLDRTVALRSGEVAPAGIDFEYAGLERPVGLESGFPDDLEAGEVSLYGLLSMASRGDPAVVGIPVFTARYIPSQLFWTTRDRNLARLSDLAGGSVGFHSADMTARIWAETLLTNSHSVAPGEVEWIELDSEDVLRSALTHVDAVCLRPPIQDASLVPVVPAHETSSEQLRAVGGVLPIFHLVVIRADVYSKHRWMAIELMDAFIRAKSIGMGRLRYFGALAVGLPWLRRAVNNVDTNFNGDAYPYGLSENLYSLKEFTATASRTRLIDDGVQPEDLFAPETVDFPGKPNQTSYVVPLSGARSWS